MENRLPLSGIRVVELATVVAAPTAGRLLSDYGAKVIKIETPGAGDLQRKQGEAHEMPIEEDNNPLFDVFNSGKELIALNLKSEDGKEAFWRLLDEADVFLTNVRMQSLEKLGIAYEQIRDRFPRLVYAHFSGFGLKGEDRNRPGFDMSAFWMRCGMSADWVLKDGFPMRATYGFGDIATSGYIVSGILMGLIGRKQTGRGTFLSVSLMGAGVWHNTTHILNTQPQYGRELPADRYHPWDPFSDFYQCSDGSWIAPVKKVYAKDRYTFAKIFDMPQLAEDDRYSSINRMRQEGVLPECVKNVAEAISGKSRQEWEEIFTENDVPFEVARHSCEVYKDKQAWDNGYLENVEYPGGVVTAVPTPPIQFSEYGRRPFTREGTVGCDTDRVLQELGYGAQEVEDLRREGAVQ